MLKVYLLTLRFGYICYYLSMKNTITICSSANFYKHTNEIQDKLEAAGYTVLVPHNAKQMRNSGNYDAGHYRTWLNNEDEYDKKTDFMRKHFDEIEKADSILVVNDEKHGRPGYIGGNVLIEMALAFYLHKPIYVLNPLDAESSYLEELKGMGSIIIDGDLSKLR